MEKYVVDDLHQWKKFLENANTLEITHETAVQMWDFVDLHSAEKDKDLLSDWFADEFSLVHRASLWEALCRTHPELIDRS